MKPAACVLAQQPHALLALRSALRLLPLPCPQAVAVAVAAAPAPAAAEATEVSNCTSGSCTSKVVMALAWGAPQALPMLHSASHSTRSRPLHIRSGNGGNGGDATSTSYHHSYDCSHCEWPRMAPALHAAVRCATAHLLHPPICRRCLVIACSPTEPPARPLRCWHWTLPPVLPTPPLAAKSSSLPNPRFRRCCAGCDHCCDSDSEWRMVTYHEGAYWFYKASTSCLSPLLETAAAGRLGGATCSALCRRAPAGAACAGSPMHELTNLHAGSASHYSCSPAPTRNSAAAPLSSAPSWWVARSRGGPPCPGTAVPFRPASAAWREHSPALPCPRTPPPRPASLSAWAHPPRPLCPPRPSQPQWFTGHRSGSTCGDDYCFMQVYYPGT